jgi:hypothetical protein
MDLFVVPIFSFRLLYGLLIMGRDILCRPVLGGLHHQYVRI